MIEMTPALPLLIAASTLAFARKHMAIRLVIVITASLWALATIWSIPLGSLWTVQYLGLEIIPLEVRPVARLFGSIFAVMAGLAGLFAIDRDNAWELPAAYLYAGSAVGAAFSGDWISLLIFWEIMAIASTVIIWSGGQKNSHSAGMRYVMVHLLGGIFLMTGIVGVVTITQSARIAPLDFTTISDILILIGILVNAAAPPLSAWAADAYPEASPSGTVFLSAFTTKTAVFVLWLTAPGAEILVWVGLYMAVYGVIYALLENDLRRILIYALINQVGFLVAAIGMGSTMTMNGAAAHAVVHIMYKGVLIMTAGAVLKASGKRLLSDLGGLHKCMPVTTICAVIAMLTGGAVPLTAAFATKSLISSGTGYMGYGWAWAIITGTGAAIFAGSMLRFVYFVFFHESRHVKASEASWNQQIAMLIGAALCIIVGIQPNIIYQHLPLTMEYYTPFKLGAMMFQAQLLGFAALGFFVFRGIIQPNRDGLLDWDWFYRRFFYRLAEEFRIRNATRQKEALGTVKAGVGYVAHQLEQTHGERGSLARTWPSGSTALWATGLLSMVLLACYLADGHF